MTWFYGIWNSLWLWVCQGIYIFISALYQVFEKVSSVNLFSSEMFKELTSRIYIIIAVGILFVFAYYLVLTIINPDGKEKTGEMSKVVKNTVIAIVMIILLPLIFNWMYVFQNHFLESNIFATILLGNAGSSTADGNNCAENDYDCTCDFQKYNIENYKVNSKSKLPNDPLATLQNDCKSFQQKNGTQQGAYSIAPIIFSTFYRPTNFDFDTCVKHLQDESHSVLTDKDEQQMCINYFYDTVDSKYVGSIAPFTNDSYLKDIVSDSNNYTMEFHWIMAVIAGVLAVYMFICYALEVGVRVAKLGFLQLISPVALMFNILPKTKEKYTAWLKELKSTYLDVFYRLLIIDFALYGISLLPNIISTMWTSSMTGDGNDFVKMLTLTIVILGMLKFAQDAPALFKTILGGSGKFSLKSPGKQLSENKYAMGALGAIGGGVSTAVKNGFGGGNVFAGFGSGAIRGARAGAKSKSFGELRTNTTGAVDRAIDARERRKVRKQSKGGPLVYHARNIGDSFKTWATEDSLQLLQQRRDVVSTAQQNYAKVVSSTKDYITSHEAKFEYDGKSIEAYNLQMQKANADYTNFDETEYSKYLKSNTPNMSDTALSQAINARKEQLLKDATDANKAYNDAVTNTTDAVIQLQRTKGSTDNLSINFDGKTVTSKGQVDNLGSIIQTADNYLDTNATQLEMATGETIDHYRNISDKSRRNELSSSTAEYDAKIATKRQKQNKKNS